MSLGNYENFHDVDLVFKGSLQENLQVAYAMRDLVVRDPHRRIMEGGKGWNIRFYNDRNTFMCNFFSYKNPEDAPLKEFEMDVIFPNVSVVGKVSDDTHTMYTPSIFSLSNTSFSAFDEDNNEERFVSDEIPVIVYHTATRGECFYRDIVRAQGAYVHITTPDDEYDAVCVIEREGVRNLTPSWNGYYED